jgi:putative endonuclease
MHSVYVLKSKKDGSLYKGYSNNLKERLIEHQKGYVSATKDKRPLELVYCEMFKNRKDAMQRELFFKTGWGRNYLKKVLSQTLKEIN